MIRKTTKCIEILSTRIFICRFCLKLSNLTSTGQSFEIFKNKNILRVVYGENSKILTLLIIWVGVFK